MNKQEANVENILEELNQMPGVIGSLVTGKDGLVIANKWNQETEADVVGADSAEIFSTADAIVNDKLLFGPVNLITLEMDKAKFFLKNVDDSSFIVLAATPKINVGLARAELAEAASKLKEAQ
jgi:predicted regulator of Ras-like GTPase activity (Roadblock/LC7/MglB family)